MKKHWTQRSIKDYLFRIAADFISQIEDKMESEELNQDELAKKLNVSKGAVSQILNNPGNITLETIIRYASVVGLKVSIVAYEDNDPENNKGLINSEIFKICWEKANKPRDFWAFEEIIKNMAVANTANLGLSVPLFDRAQYPNTQFSNYLSGRTLDITAITNNIQDFGKLFTKR
jgi:transcriptional regulator with XRE-family HTH domain